MTASKLEVPTVLVCIIVSMEEFLEQAGPQLPTLRGLKYTSKDLMEFGRCVINQAEKYQIIYGCDEVRDLILCQLC